MRKLDDDWKSIGRFGNTETGHTISIGNGHVYVHVRAKTEAKTRRYRLPRIYARLLIDAHERGRQNQPLYTP